MRLFDLIDAVNDACFWQGKIATGDQAKLARQIVSCQGKPGAYANTFALSETERKAGITLFTGEITKSAAARHIAGEEACRALLLLGSVDQASQDALARASNELLSVLGRSEKDRQSRMGGNPGTFCCGRCSVSIWRHLTAGGLDRMEERLLAGLKRLKAHRSDDGRWGIFPFWYTLSALVEIDISPVKTEIRYAAPMLERAAKRKTASNAFDERRIEIARRCLQKI